MDSKEYQRRVLETESKPDVINFGTLGTHAILGLITKTADIVDAAKKKMFYNSPKFDIAQVAADARTLAEIATCIAEWADAGLLIDAADIELIDIPDHLKSLDLEQVNKRLLHVVLGVNSESGEKAEAIRIAWEAGKPVDRVNFAEEVGDALWYIGVAADELNVPFTTLFEQNITKLQDKKDGRYKQGSFDVDGANYRDLQAERALLEKSIDSKGAVMEALAALTTTEGGEGLAHELENKWAGNTVANADGTYSGLDEDGNENCRLLSRVEVARTLERYSQKLNGTLSPAKHASIS